MDGRRLSARLPRVQGLREKMLIGRSDDPHNPCRVAAFKVSSVWEWIAEPIWASGECRDKQAGHTTATVPDRNSLASPPRTQGAVHTRPTLALTWYHPYPASAGFGIAESGRGPSVPA
jgi:hypothetical protein